MKALRSTSILLKLALSATVGLLSSCGGTLDVNKPLKPEKLKDGLVRTIALEDPFVWTQLYTKIEATTPDGEQKFRVQLRTKQDSILWAAISDDLIGLRVGKAIVLGDSAAFSSTLLGMEWTGSANDLAKVTGVEVPFQYLNRLMRGQLIGTNQNLKYRYNAWSELWVATYELSDSRRVTLALNTDLKMSWIEITDEGDQARIDYSAFDNTTGYPIEMMLTLKSRPEYVVKISVQEVRTGGPFKTPFSL